MWRVHSGRARSSWRTALLSFAAAALTIGLSACQGTTSANGGGPPPPMTDATVSFCDDGAENCTPATSFSVSTLRDLIVNVNWENLSTGTHTQTLEILMPGGGLYQSGQTSFLVADSSQSSLTMTRTVPVAGAWIAQRRITGEWSVRVLLDGNAITSQTVNLNP
ncbi:MAG: hypothetical protein ACRD59_16865 [Candidatus Acidiferrales bacterium]